MNAKPRSGSKKPNLASAKLTPQEGRLAIGLGSGAMISIGFHWLKGAQYQLLQIEGNGLILLLALGALAAAGGILKRPLVCLVSGVGLLGAAVVSLAQLGGSRSLGGNGSTFAVFLGFGIGLSVLGLAALIPAPVDRQVGSGPSRQRG